MEKLTIQQIARQIAKEMRNNPTEAELALWQKLRKNQFMGYKFLFQHPIFYRRNDKLSFFITDFYCHKLKLAVEVDGGIHLNHKEYDQIRTDLLKQKNISVIRIKNQLVLSEVSKVLIELKRKIDEISKLQ